MIIQFNGMPGTGKLTVAKALAAMTGARLIDNHALINAAYVCSEHGTDTYVRVLDSIVETVYTALEQRPAGETLIFTNALAAGEARDERLYNRVVRLAQARNAPYIPVLLTCDRQVNLGRIGNPDRTARQKLTDPAILESLIDRYTILHPADHPYALALDTSVCSAAETAQKVFRHMQVLGLASAPALQI